MKIPNQTKTNHIITIHMFLLYTIISPPISDAGARASDNCCALPYYDEPIIWHNQRLLADNCNIKTTSNWHWSHKSHATTNDRAAARCDGAPPIVRDAPYKDQSNDISRTRQIPLARYHITVRARLLYSRGFRRGGHLISGNVFYHNLTNHNRRSA